MGDDITEEDVKKLIPDAVRQAYEEEAAFIAERVKWINQTGESWIQEALTWVPYVDAIFEEPEKGIAAATSDVNREQRVSIVIAKIEKGLGYALDGETKANIRDDIYDMYNDNAPQ